MDMLNLVIGSCLVLSGLITIAISIPLLLGKVKRNTYYGVRSAAGFESDEVWFRINRYGAKRLIVWSMPVLAVGVAAFFVSFEGRPWLAVVLGLLPAVFLTAPVFEVQRFMRHMRSEE